MKSRDIIALVLMLLLGCSPAIAQVNPGTSPLSGAKGGTNNAFMQFTGPAASMKTFTVPNASSTLAAINAIQTWTAAQSFTDGTLILLGSGSGSSTLKAPATGGGTATLFPGTDTVAGLAATQALTNKTINCASNTCTVRIASDVSGLGTGVATALGVNVGGAGAFVVNGGALGTPSSGTGTNLTGVPVSTGISGLGPGVATALGNALNGSGGLVGFSGGLGTPTSGVLTNATGLPANGGLTGQVPIANGGTGQSTAAAARASSGLNVDQFTGHGDSIYTILATDRTVATNAAFTASRTWTLPAANAVNPGQEIIVADFQGTVTGTNTLVISRAGADTINGGASATISAASGSYLLRSDGVSKWTAQALGASAVSGVSAFNGLTGVVTTDMVVQPFTAGAGTYIYTPTTNMHHAVMECVGSGGGGGGSNGTASQTYGAGGGGGGAYSRKMVTAAQVGATATIVIGAAGSGGAAGSNNGTAGSNVTITSAGSVLLLQANGGAAGTFASGAQVPSGGAGGTTGTGDIIGRGNPGGNGAYIATALVSLASGAGGSSAWGGGANGVNAPGNSVNGQNGSNYGAGGSGAESQAASTGAGGNGSAGACFITDFVNF